MDKIAENVARIRAQIAEAAIAAGRDPASVQLCAATKMNDADAVRRAVAAGVDCCGENRVQELTEKLPQGAYTGKPIHFIGHLQKNKAKFVVGAVDLIQSVDSVELMQLLNRLAGERGICQDILLEVNIGGEAAKSGAAPADLEELLEQMAVLPGISVQGLMTVPPISEKEKEKRQFFSKMRHLSVDIKEKNIDNIDMQILSMGMSGDYPEAILEGATLIRVGSAIFGQRVYP